MKGPLGKIVGEAHPYLLEEVNMAVHTSETNYVCSIRAMTLKYQAFTKTEEFKADTKSTVTNKEFLDW